MINPVEDGMAFSFEDRARQKAEARARDEDRLARGEIPAADLQKENAHFARALSGQNGPFRVGVSVKGKLGKRRYMEFPPNKVPKDDS
jgi:hypothetical protein